MHNTSYNALLMENNLPDNMQNSTETTAILDDLKTMLQRQCYNDQIQTTKLFNFSLSWTHRCDALDIWDCNDTSISIEVQAVAIGADHDAIVPTLIC